MEAGLDLRLWIDPAPWADAPTATPPVMEPTDTSKAVVERKMKFSAVLGQGDESRRSRSNAGSRTLCARRVDSPWNRKNRAPSRYLLLAEEGELRWSPLRGLLGVAALREEGSQDAEVPVLHGRLHDEGDPGTWFVRPMESQLQGLQDCNAHARHPDDGYVRGMRGPFQKVDRLYPGAWHLIVAASDLGRSERFVRLRVSVNLDTANGTKEPMGWAAENPWECLFRMLVKDASFWAEQGHVPANAWLAHGSKGKPLTPAEAVAAASIQGGINAIKPETESTAGTPSSTRRTRNVRSREAKRKQAEAEGQADAKRTQGDGNGKGKGKEKPQACYAWNNNNGACAGLPPGAACQGRVSRAHVCTKCGSVGHPSERWLIVELQVDWNCRTSTTRRWQDLEADDNRTSWHPPFWLWAGSSPNRRERGRRDDRSEEKEKVDNRRSGSRRRRRQCNEDKAEFNGKIMTLDVYLMKRRFFFLHLYSGLHDPLGTTLESLAKRYKMKVTMESYDRENGGADLLAEQSYAKLLQQAREGRWDGYHAGFPCTSFWWRERERATQVRTAPDHTPMDYLAIRCHCKRNATKGRCTPPDH